MMNEAAGGEGTGSTGFLQWEAEHSLEPRSAFWIRLGL